MSALEDGPAYERDKRRTTVLISLASILEKCDEQILPAVYAWVGASFGATPTQLGQITLGRALMQALASPLGGVSSQFFPRGSIIGAGCLVWATMTALFATTTSLSAAMPICAFNGVGLALVIPNVQSLVADYYSSHTRGKAFGALWLVISMGGMLGALYATNVGAHRPFGIEGWRFVFLSVASVSAVTGIANALFVKDPTFKPRTAAAPGSAALPRADPLEGSTPAPSKAEPPSLASLWRDVRSVMAIPTFGIIILQGIVGSVPYSSLVFLTLYLQLMGMSNGAASALVALYLAGGGLGGLLGGWVGDAAARLSPSHGRVVVTQFSVAIGIPFAALVFKGLPLSGSAGAVAAYAVALLSWALLTAWPAPACNNPIFAEIVPAQHRNLVYSFDRCFEGAIAACVAPFVGLLAERWFGFSGASTVTGDLGRDSANARALGDALLAFTTLPWALCLLAYSGLHLTYPADRRAALAAERAAAAAAEQGAGALCLADGKEGADSDCERRSTGSASGEAAGLLVSRAPRPPSQALG